MSGLLERIVRRRRASASRRLGPPSSDTVADGNGRVDVNGAAPAEPAIRALHETQPGLAGPSAEEAQSGTAAQAPPLPDAETPESGELAAASEPGLRERGRIRRRARYLRRLREVQLRDVGGFVLELDRFGRERPDLVQAKIDNAARTDAELRALERALREHLPLRELREPGIGGACPECGAVHGSEDRFCASCGEPLRDDDSPADDDPFEYGHVYPE